MRNVLFISALFVLYNSCATAQHETRFYVEVDSTAIAVGDPLNVSFILENGKNNNRFTAPDWEAAGFMVLSNSQSSNISITNGQTSTSAEYRFTVTPVEEGDLIIPSVTIKNGDQELHTESITIPVMRNADGTRPILPKKIPAQPKNEPKKRIKGVWM